MSVTSENDRQSLCRTASGFNAGIMSVIPRDDNDVPLLALFIVSDENLVPIRGVLADAGVKSNLFTDVFDGYSVVELDGHSAASGVPIVEAWQATLD